MYRHRLLLTLSVAILTMAAAPAAFASSFSYAGPPHNSIDTATFTIVPLNVVGTGTIQKLDLSVSIGTIYADDVSIYLEHNGTTEQVYVGHGDTLNSIINATFDDAASASAPYNGSAVGTFTPSPGTLSAFNGMPLAGTWNLELIDYIVPGDGTPLLSWSISGNAVPEPATQLLTALLLAGLTVFRSRLTKAGRR